MHAMSMINRLSVVVIGLWLAVGPVAHAQQGPRQARVTQSADAQKRVRVDALVVHASNAGTKVDPRLRGLDLSRFSYTSYKVLSSHTDTVTPGQTATVSVVGGRKLRVAFLEHTPKGAKVRLQLFASGQKKLDSTIQLPRDRTFLVGGPKHDGGVLMFPITVSY